jgi:hypothetical protein
LCGLPFSQSQRATTAVVDHCHASGAVRGLIHFNCNSGLGMFGDDLAKLRLAVGYLQRAKRR